MAATWDQDSAEVLLDLEGRIVTWSPGAARIYLYSADQAVGKHVSALYFMDGNNGSEPQGELTRSAAEGHFGSEGWHVRKDGTRFWANVITLALRDEGGELQGFARIVRDFGERHERDEKPVTAAHGFDGCLCGQPSPGSYPVSSIGFPKPKTRS